MQTEPDVLTEHNELILSTSIERVVTGRDTALKQIEQLIQQLDAISRLTSEIGGGTAQDWAMKSGHRYDSWLTEKADKALPAIIRNIDRCIWRDLMLKSGMMSGKDRPLLAHPPLRTVLASFPAHGSSLSKSALANRFHYFNT